MAYDKLRIGFIRLLNSLRYHVGSIYRNCPLEMNTSDPRFMGFRLKLGLQDERAQELCQIKSNRNMYNVHGFGDVALAM